jgi:3-hydroxyacyl-CoA dehydrogenase
MFYADTVGLKKVYERICGFEQQHGKLWTPAPLLKRLAEEGKKFSDVPGRGLSVPAAGANA